MGNIQELVGTSPGVVAAGMNRWIARGWWQVTAALSFSAIFAMAALGGASGDALGRVGVCMCAAFLYVRFLEKRRRRIFLDYELDAEGGARFLHLGECFRALSRKASGGRLRVVESVDACAEWKENGGATRSIVTGQADLRRRGAPRVVCAREVWSLFIDKRQLSFYPDHLLIWDGVAFAVCPYKDLEISTHVVDLIWLGEVPAGAEIVGQRWRYIRRDGEADRRYANNHHVPLVRTTCVLLQTATGYTEVMQSTSQAEMRAVSAALYDAVERAKAAAALPEQDPTEKARLCAAAATLDLVEEPGTALALEAVTRRARALTDELRRPRGSFEVALVDLKREREIEEARRALVQYLEARIPPTPVDPETLSFARRDSSLPLSTLEIWVAAGVLLFCVPMIAAPAERSKEAPPEPAVTAPLRATTAEAEPSSQRVELEALVTECALRHAPSSSARRLAILSKDAQVEVIEERGGWRKVSGPLGIGWTARRCWVAAAPPRPSKPARTVRAARAVEAPAPAAATPDVAPVDPHGEAKGIVVADDDPDRLYKEELLRDLE